MGQGGKVSRRDLPKKPPLKSGWPKKELFIKNLSSKDANVRYWGAIGLAARKDKPSGKALKKLKTSLKDSSAAVRIEAANALATHGDVKTALPVLLKDLAHENLIIVTHAARTIELLGKEASSAAPQMRKALDSSREDSPARSLARHRPAWRQGPRHVRRLLLPSLPRPAGEEVEL